MLPLPEPQSFTSSMYSPSQIRIDPEDATIDEQRSPLNGDKLRRRPREREDYRRIDVANRRDTRGRQREHTQVRVLSNFQ